MEIVVEHPDWPAAPILQETTQAAVSAAIEAAAPRLAPASELCVVFSHDDAVRSLNRQWRGQDKPTNVLSFPAGDYTPAKRAGPLLGDVILALQTIQTEANLEGHQFEHHVKHLIVHGFLHLLGYDHQVATQAELMEQLEVRALAKLGIANPYS